MSTLYVARSPSISKWASDVGLGRHVFKVGVTEGPAKPVVQAGWAGMTDWVLVKQADVPEATETEVLDRLARREKPLDPDYYPRLKGATGIFKVSARNVENQMLMERALAGADRLDTGKLKPADFAAYLIRNATA